MCSMFSFEGISCILDISKLQFLAQTNKKNVQRYLLFLQFWSSKLWIRISLKRYVTQIAHISMLFHLSVSFTLPV